MKMQQIEQPNMNNFMHDFYNQNQSVSSLFHYMPSTASYEKRAKKLQNHPASRKELSRVIRSFMGDLPPNDKVEKHLKELEENAFVVIGGQQAGLLTGPLYSIHKAISVILLAKQQRDALQHPVIPVFWIAGEDHDLDEINSTFTHANGRLVKHTYNDRPNRKQMAFKTEIEPDKVSMLIESIFKQTSETMHTKKLLLKLKSFASNSRTYSEFFSKLMNDFFVNEGLLLIDAAYEPLRKLESPYFTKMIEESHEISKRVVQQEQLFNEMGYGEPIQAAFDNAHLFFVQDGERFLLKRQDNLFINEAGSIELTKEELLEIAQKTPEQLSNNVVTRPLMQEMLFPVLAFVGGPGELAYWATFKTVFEHFDMELPVMVPRLSITLVDRKSAQYLENLQLSIEDAFDGHLLSRKEDFIIGIQDDKAHAMISEMQNSLNKHYEEFKAYIETSEISIGKIVDTNLDKHQKQFTYLKQKVEDDTLIRHETMIRKFQHLEGMLYPEQSLQERNYSPYLFMNEAGESLVEKLFEMPFEFNGKHSIIYI
ncbi:MAG: bacillithiol biosynthesis cysteine-adding enzyme BshC [Firmicutes bacterium]|nr:bacillithiol biosynthesis cysteine-adding enzyme BshC [Bacillota bacterium]